MESRMEHIMEEKKKVLDDKRYVQNHPQKQKMKFYQIHVHQ